MSIYNALGIADLSEGWVGNSKLAEVWVGDNIVWTATSLLAEASLYMDFESSANFLKNKGTSQNIAVTSVGTVSFKEDHALFVGDGRFIAQLQSTWDIGYTFSAWVKNIASSSGWRTFLHRAKTGMGPYTNETYIVFNTTGSNSTLVSGLKHGSNHKETYCTTPIPAGADWAHVAVRWGRESATTWTCAFFVNGQFISQTTLTGYSSSDTFAPDENELRLGGDFDGEADDIAMWRRPLTSEEILRVYSEGRTVIPQIITTSFDKMKKGAAFSQQIVANFPVTSWSATGLPAGLTINTSTGVVSGTPTSSGTGTATITANANGITRNVSLPWSFFSSFNIPFNSDMDITTYLPTRGFDARTASNSPKRAAFTYNGMLVAGDNNVDTYWQGLYGEEFFAEQAEWILTTGDVMNVVARPTEIILSSTIDFRYQLLLQIGSGNLNLVSRTTGAITSLKTQSRTIGNNSTIRVVRNGLSITVYHNGTSVYTYTGTTSNAAVWFRTAGRGYTGVTMYSSSGQWSSRVGNLSGNETG